jgi:hypothetical protein
VWFLVEMQSLRVDFCVSGFRWFNGQRPVHPVSSHFGIGGCKNAWPGLSVKRFDLAFQLDQ